MSYNNTKTPIKPTDEAKWQVPMRPRANGGSMEYFLEGELKERFCKLFPKHTNRRLMQWFGISFSTLQRFKREFGLEKDMKAICKEHEGRAVYAYAQPYRDPTNPNQVIPEWQKDMARWCNKRMIFCTTDFKDFSPRKGFKCELYLKEYGI